MSNFHVIAHELIEAGAVVRVDSAEQLVTMALSVLTEPGRREQLALAAEAWHARNAGAVARTLAIVQTELARRPVA
ncbi:MAG: hypothetical protein EBU32_12305 [Opitutaceae bacterium]|nr:hypothetical protein [Opitutaceae bacterium]